MLKHITIISSPITERYVRPGMLAILDTVKNQVQAGGVWFDFDDRWEIKELKPQDQIVQNIVSGDSNKLSLDKYVITSYILWDGKQISSEEAIKEYKQQGKTFEDLWQRLTKENKINDDMSKDIVQTVRENMFKQWEKM